MNILVAGGGAREHSLVWKLRQGARVSKLYVAPGNAGTAAIAENLDIEATDLQNLARAATDRNIDLAVIGPEAPLAEGIVDLFEKHGIPTFGPNQLAAVIESSKVFAKELLQKYGIPCAKSETFSSFGEAKDYVLSQTVPIVVKVDGLAAGKGSIVASTTDEAVNALSEIMEERAFGSAGDRVLVEECLDGVEVSLLAFTDGITVVPMVPACDYKRVFDGDKGPNTGGMGAYSPPGFFDDDMTDLVKRIVLEPTVAAMTKEGRPYRGVLYAGIMVTDEGPKVLEFNARFGDPENQVMMPRLKSDLVEVMLAVIEQRLDGVEVEWSEQACVGVVIASGGYPGGYEKGFAVSGLDAVDEDVAVFHAGTKTKDGRVVTDGGRVLTVAATGGTIAEAREKAYSNVARVHFEGCHYRKDIALREVG
ncbi:MAG: phosphoribosylamine--glycine ligase [Chloroflexota bacterium]|nr:phosphoribosylamine--glycine ligase [Chloroflexota bacterium]